MIEKLIEREGYQFTAHPHDTVNIVCRRGHVYQDGVAYVAAMDNATPAESRALRALGVTIMDGDNGELSVKFLPYRLRNVMRIMRPRYDLSRKAG